MQSLLSDQMPLLVLIGLCGYETSHVLPEED